jgi:hypothetical protein
MDSKATLSFTERTCHVEFLLPTRSNLGASLGLEAFLHSFSVSASERAGRETASILELEKCKKPAVREVADKTCEAYYTEDVIVFVSQTNGTNLRHRRSTAP